MHLYDRLLTLPQGRIKALEGAQPDAVAMLSRVPLDTDTLSEWTYALAVENQDPSAFAAKWVEQNQAIVDKWFE